MTSPPSRQADPQERPVTASTLGNPQSSTAPHEAARQSDTPHKTGNLPAPAVTNRRGIGFYFWSTIFVLIAITGMLVILAWLRPAPDMAATEGAQPQVSIAQRLVDRFQQQSPEILEQAQQAGQRAVAKDIDKALDRIFDPVYAAIPNYADFHYSVWGQYAELLAAGAETLGIEEEVGSIMREKIFAGFEERHSEQMAYLSGAFQTAAEASVERDAERLAADIGEPLTDALRQAVADTKRRMVMTVPAGSAAATATVVVIVKPIAKKIVTSTAAKAAAKGIGKAGGIGGAAMGGALAGSVLGPVGTAVGGIGGAVAGWLAVDYAVVKLDEYFNREEFEAELAAAIDEQKGAMREEILRIFGAEG